MIKNKKRRPSISLWKESVKFMHTRHIEQSENILSRCCGAVCLLRPYSTGFMTMGSQVRIWLESFPNPIQNSCQEDFKSCPVCSSLSYQTKAPKAPNYSKMLIQPIVPHFLLEIGFYGDGIPRLNCTWNLCFFFTHLSW